ncbi:MAG: hypothetical protein IKJ22_07000 [Paludibacteraceae bacterium]|nr:hypothetical protein [Paludibacteraceae bacterium]
MKKITIIALILGSIFTAYSQETQKEVSRDLTVEREYDPTVVNAKKISPTPQKEVVEVKQPEITYTTWSKVEKTDKKTAVQDPTEFQTERSYDTKKGMFKAGLGFYWQTLGEFYYPLVEKENHLLDISAKHHSSWGKITLEDGTKPRAMDHLTDIAMNYETSFKKAKLETGVSYKYNGYDYYGMSTILDDVYKNAVGSNSDVDFNLKLYSTNHKSKFHYQVHAGYKYFDRNYDISAHMIKAGVELAGKLSKGELGAEIDADVDVLNMNDRAEDSHPHTAGILKFNPFYKIHGEDWAVNIGGNLFVDMNKEAKRPVTGSANISAHVGIVPDLFYLYGGIGGNYKPNYYYEILRENQYITPDLEVSPTYTPFDLNLGLRIRIMEGLLFNVGFDYSIILDQYFYVNHVVNDSETISTPIGYTNTFDVVTESTTHMVDVNAGLYFDYVKGLNLGVTAGYNYWGVKENAYAWQKPSWKVEFMGTYRFLEKWEVGLSYKMLADRKALVMNEVVKMNDIHDVDVWASYKALDWLTVFIKGKNLANQKSDTYYGYRNFGINGLAGVTMLF